MSVQSKFEAFSETAFQGRAETYYYPVERWLNELRTVQLKLARNGEAI